MSSAQTRKPFSPSLQVSIRSLRVEITSLVSKVMKLLLLIQQVSGTTNDRAAWAVVQPVLTQHLHRQNQGAQGAGGAPHRGGGRGNVQGCAGVAECGAARGTRRTDEAEKTQADEASCLIIERE